MTKQEAERQTRQADTLRALGFTREECEKLRRISMTLQRWYELECGINNGCIERDEATGKPYWLNSMTMKQYPITDRERGALRRLAAIIGQRNHRMTSVPNSFSVSTYIQTDPRGAALYIIRPGDVPEGAVVESYYSRGICVY